MRSFRKTVFLVIGVGILAASPAFAQQAKFDPKQCEQRSAGECNDLMAALGVPPDQREETLAQRAQARLQAHDLDGAIAEFREITTVNPHSPMVFGNLGLLETIGEKWADAAKDLGRALDLAPDHNELRPMLAVALARSGDCAGAKQAIAAAGKDPETPKLGDATADVGKACP